MEMIELIEWHWLVKISDQATRKRINCSNEYSVDSCTKMGWPYVGNDVTYHLRVTHSATSLSSFFAFYREWQVQFC